MTPVTASMPPGATSAPRHGGVSTAAGTPGATSRGTVSRSVTASDGTPGYGWTLFINGQLIAANGTMPPGFETTVSYANGQDVTETLEGKPELTGTVVVTPNPNVKTLQP
jgi:hypothetical protein